MDGVNVSLGIIAEHVGSDTFSDFSKMAKLGKNDTQQNVELIMLTNGIPMFTVNTEMTCYHDFLKNGSSCQSLTFNSYNAKTAFNNTTWLINKINNGFGRSQVIISPELAHRTATEYGFFDYSLALVSTRN